MGNSGTRGCNGEVESDESSLSGDDASQTSGSEEASRSRGWICGSSSRRRRGGDGFIPASTLNVRTKKKRGRPPSRAQVLIADNEGKKIEDYFEVRDEAVLGDGGFASVCSARNIRTGAERALKKIDKQKAIDETRLQQEVEIMLMMDHPNIVKLFQTFEDQQYLYLVLEVLSGGELFDLVINQGHVVERDTAIIMQQMLRAVRYMHEAGICHRDLKPENFLFQSKAPIESNTLKIIDFGIAARCEPGEYHMYTKTGTPFYVAPEVLNRWTGGYGPECDLWSCGVVMFALLCGGLPFKGRNDAETLKLVKRGKFEFTRSEWKEVSEDAKDLIRELLVVKPSERLTAEEALDHTWVAEFAPRGSPAPLRPEHLDRLRRFTSENRMKRVALQVIARQLDPRTIAGLRSIFTDLDANGDGTLTMAELRAGLERAGLVRSDAELREIADSMDADASGVIDYTEFLAATIAHRDYLHEGMCWQAFRAFDRNDDGLISIGELQEVLASQMAAGKVSREQAQQLMAEVDSNRDGFIDFPEFMAMMRK